MTRTLAFLALFPLFCAAQDAGPTAPSFDQLSARAAEAFNANRSAEAVDLFTQALKLKPSWPEGWWALGTLHYDANQYPECRDDLTRLVALDESAIAGWALLGLCEFETKDFDASFQHLKRAHTMFPPGSSGQLLDVANYHLGLLLTRQGAFELSQEILVRVAEHVKDNPGMMFGCGLPALRMAILPAEVPKDQKEAVFLAGKTFWDLTTRPPAQAEADFATLLAKYPSFPSVHYFYGTYLAVHRPDTADAEFIQELHITPDSVPARVQLVLRYLLEQRIEEALKLAREAVALSPDSVGTQLALGRVLRERGDHDGALAAFLAAKRLDPVSPAVRPYLITEYRALGRMDDMRREQADYDLLKSAQKNWP
jgi:tetratricopeptide (TPR) repeat protein